MRGGDRPGGADRRKEAIGGVTSDRCRRRTRPCLLASQLAGVDSETAAVDQDVQRRLLLVLRVRGPRIAGHAMVLADRRLIKFGARGRKNRRHRVTESSKVAAA